MKLTTFLAAFAGLDLVSASPTSAGLAAKKPAWTLLKRTARLIWNPLGAFEDDPKSRADWEQKCGEALARAGCGVGVIYPSEKSVKKPNGELTSSYVNVQGAESLAHYLENSKKMRVFHDGSTEDGWSEPDEAPVPAAENPKMPKNEAEEGTRTPEDNPAKLKDTERLSKKRKKNDLKEEPQPQAGTDSMRGNPAKPEDTKRLPRKRRKVVLYEEPQSPEDMEYTGESPKKVSKKRTWTNPKGLKVFKHKRKNVPTDDGAQSSEGNPLSWQPVEAYRTTQPEKRKFWDRVCEKALADEKCSAGTIYKGETWLDRDGVKTSYIKMSATPVGNPKAVRTLQLRVFQDGSIDNTNWSGYDKKQVARTTWAPKLHRLGTAETEGPKALLSWDPVDSYARQKHRKWFWEQICHKALTDKGCKVGLIHMGEISSRKPDGNKTYYLNVEGAPTMADMKNANKMRVFEDGTSQIRHDWSVQEWRAIQKAKQPNKRPLALLITSPQERTEAGFTPTISWNPPNAYLPSQSLLREKYERACVHALRTNGCKFGTIHQGYHTETSLEKPDGRKTRYMNVSAGKNTNNPRKMRYMRVFEDGSSWWYPPGPLPRKDFRRHQEATPTRNHLMSGYKSSKWKPKVQPVKHEPKELDAADARTQLPTQGDPKRQKTRATIPSERLLTRRKAPPSASTLSFDA